MVTSSRDNDQVSMGCSRRSVLATAGSAILGFQMLGCGAGRTNLFRLGDQGGVDADERIVKSVGPASKYTPVIQVTFVRRKEDYGMRWPGAIYDGEAALKLYRQKIEATAKEYGVKVVIRPEPVYSEAEADEWVAQAKSAKSDGLLVVLLDRHEHSWPTATKAVDSDIPTVVFAPVGTAFTTNTRRLAGRTGLFICSTDDFQEAALGIKMLATGAKLREMRYIVLKGDKRYDTRIPRFGTRMRYVPAAAFLEEYKRTPDTKEIEAITRDYLRQATHIHGPTKRDILNGVKSYVVARTIMEREEGDGITMDCLGALGKSKVSLPCIAWSRMLDRGVPAACEADWRACVPHALVQYLFDRPGFQQDPVPETSRGCLIGSHCSCPTRIKGFSEPAEPFYLSHHHGNRDAVPRTVWPVGQRMTVVGVEGLKEDVLPKFIVSSGEVVENISVPPSGGCVVAVTVKLDGVESTLDYPGFHQLFVCGDFKRELLHYCTLFGIEPVVV